MPGQVKACQSVLDELQGPLVGPENKILWMGEYVVPLSFYPTNLGGCFIIEVDYILEVSTSTTAGPASGGTKKQRDFSQYPVPVY